MQDSPVGVKPLRYIWYQWVFEVFALLVTAGSIVVDFRRLRVLFVALITANTPLLSNTIDLALSLGADAPGSNGTALRANIAAAGVIVVVIANFLIILAAGLSYLDDEEGPSERKKSTQYETNKV